MALDILKERGVPLDRQSFTWRDLVGSPISKLDSDAFTRVRVILMNGIEMESVAFQHHVARMNSDLRRALSSRSRRVPGVAAAHASRSPTSTSLVRMSPSSTRSQLGGWTRPRYARCDVQVLSRARRTTPARTGLLWMYARRLGSLRGRNA